MNKPKTSGLRAILIHSMTREKLIDLIIRRDSLYGNSSFVGHTDDQLRYLALYLDGKKQANKQLNKNR